MRTPLLLLLATSASTASLDTAAAQEPASYGSAKARSSGGDRWPGFRGVGTSHSRAVDLPQTWSADENVAWAVDLPGYGQSSPVVWRDRVVVTSAEGAHKETNQISCYRAADGHLLWSRSYRASVEVAWSDMTSKAAPTPVIDSRRICALFESGDLVALDHDGETLWRRSFSADIGGGYRGNHGFGGSLVAAGEDVVLLLDHDGPSMLAKVAGSTGDTIWKAERTSRISWATPAIDDAHGEVVVSSNGTVDGYALSDGAVRWSVGDIIGNTVPSPTVDGQLIVVGASKGTNLALRHNANGVDIAWRAKGARPSGFGSPLVCGDAVFIVNKAGVLFCVDRENGELRWQKRLPEACWTSPIAVGDRLYFFGKSGTTTIARATADGLEIEAENSLPTEDTVYGVAVIDGAFLVREGSRLTCLRRSPSK